MLTRAQSIAHMTQAQATSASRQTTSPLVSPGGTGRNTDGNQRATSPLHFAHLTRSYTLKHPTVYEKAVAHALMEATRDINLLKQQVAELKTELDTMKAERASLMDEPERMQKEVEDLKSGSVATEVQQIKTHVEGLLQKVEEQEGVLQKEGRTFSEVVRGAARPREVQSMLGSDMQTVSDGLPPPPPNSACLNCMLMADLTHPSSACCVRQGAS